jgi:hypothetical protein
MIKMAMDKETKSELFERIKAIIAKEPKTFNEIRRELQETNHSQIIVIFNTYIFAWKYLRKVKKVCSVTQKETMAYQFFESELAQLTYDVTTHLTAQIEAKIAEVKQQFIQHNANLISVPVTYLQNLNKTMMDLIEKVDSMTSQHPSIPFVEQKNEDSKETIKPVVLKPIIEPKKAEKIVEDTEAEESFVIALKRLKEIQDYS